MGTWKLDGSGVTSGSLSPPSDSSPSSWKSALPGFAFFGFVVS